MDGQRVRGLHQGLTLGALPSGTRHVRLSLHVETPEEKRDRLRAVFHDKTGAPPSYPMPMPLSASSHCTRAEGFLAHTSAAPMFVQREVVEYKAPPVPQPEEPVRRASEAEVFTVFMGETLKTLRYRPDAVLRDELLKICHARSWTLDERIVLSLKGRLLDDLDVPLASVKQRAVQFLARDEVRPVSASSYVARERSASPPPPDLTALTPRAVRMRMSYVPAHVLLPSSTSSSTSSEVAVVTHPHTAIVTVEPEHSLASVLAEPKQCELQDVRDLYADHYAALPPEEQCTWVGEWTGGAHVGEHFFAVASLRRRREGYAVLRHTKGAQEELLVPHDSLAKGRDPVHRKLRRFLQDRVPPFA